MNRKMWTALAVFLFVNVLIAGLQVGAHSERRALAPRIKALEKQVSETSATAASLVQENVALRSRIDSMTVEVESTTAELTRAKSEMSSRGTKRIISREIIMQSTAYGPPDFPAGQHTATGAPVGPGSIAVDPSVIPLGTRLWVEGYGEGIANDTGGAIVGNIIDVWLPSYEECIQWGRRTVRVGVLE